MRLYLLLRPILFVLFLSFITVSCGGGGGGGGGTPTTDLQINTSAVSFSAETSGTLPSSQDFLVSWSRNDVAAVLVGFPPGISIPTWLDISLTGSASPLTLTLGVNTTALPDGTYTTTVRIVDGNASGGLIDVVDIPVTYTVLGGATVSPTNLTFEVNKNGDLPSAQTATLDRDGAVVTPTSVTIPPADNWLQATISGDDINFELTANASSLAAGFYQSTVTINYAGSILDITLPVSLSVNSKQVNYINPHVGYTSVSGNAIIRGHGFSDLTNPQVLIGVNPATYVTVISDSELHVGYSALAAGNYSVAVKDAVTTMTSIAELVIVDTPSYSYTSIPRIGGNAMLLFDPKRQVIYLSDSGTERELERYQFNGTSWDVSTTSLGSFGINIALSNNFDKLIKLNQNDFSVIDPASFTVTDTIAFAGINSGSSPRSLSFSNEGRAIINTTADSVGTTVHSYNFLNGGFMSLSDIPENGSPGATLTSSLDGSRVFLNINWYNYPASYYNASSGGLIETTTVTQGAEYGVSVDRTGSKIITNDTANSEVAVYDGDINALGVLPPLSGLVASSRATTFAISPDGTRAYAYLGDTQFLHVLDLTASDGSNGFLEIGSATFIPDGPTWITKMIISPDGGTLFLAGSDRLIVIPVP